MKNNILSHQYRMSAFGTKKPGGDFAVQLTFPSVYSSVYAAGADRLAYYPSAPEGVENLPVGQDLQSLYHEQKRLDANRMAMAGVRSQRISDTYARAGNAGYGVMPKPVLGQRIFANPSNGNQSDIYAARYDQMRGAGMSGGVLRTRVGQQYGRDKLNARIDQLNAIGEAKQGFLAGMPVEQSITPELVEQGVAEPEGVKAKLELFGAINQFRSSVVSGSLDRIAISEFYKSLQLLFRVATVSTSEELGDMLEAFDEVQEVLRKEEFDGVSEGANEFRFFKGLVEKIRAYIAGMLGGIQPGEMGKQSMSLKARKALSANLIRSLGLTKLPTNYREVGKPRRGDAGGAPRGDGGDGDDGGDGGDFTATVSSYANATSRGARFDPTPRDKFGSRQGSYFGEAPEEGADEMTGIRGVSAPLNEMRAPLESAEMTELADASLPSFEDASPGEEEEAAAAEGSRATLKQYLAPYTGEYQDYTDSRGEEVMYPTSIVRKVIKLRFQGKSAEDIQKEIDYPIEEVRSLIYDHFDNRPGVEDEVVEGEAAAAAAEKPPPKTMRLISKEDRSKYKIYDAGDGKKLLVSRATGKQFIQNTPGKSMFIQLAKEDEYELPEEEAVAAPAPKPAAAAAAAAAPATASNAKKIADAIARFQASEGSISDSRRRAIEIRINSGYRKTQKEIAAEVGLSQSTISKTFTSAGVA